MEIILLAILFLVFTVKMPFVGFLFTLILPGYAILSVLEADKRDKIMYSLPMSLLFVHVPYFTITRIGIGIPSAYFYIMPLIPAIYLLFKKRESISFSIPKPEFRNSTIYTAIVAIALFFAISYSFEAFVSPDTFEPFQQGVSPGVPLTLGAKYIAETEILKENILNGNGAVGWSDEWFSGMHTLTSYSPLSYMILAVSALNSEVWVMHNTLTYLFAFMFAIYLYMLLRHINTNKYVALALSFIAASLPPLVLVNNVLKTNIDLAFLPILLYSIIRLIDEPTKKNAALAGGTLAVWTLNYYFTAYIALLPLAALVTAYAALDKKKEIVKRVLESAGVAFLIGGIWNIPFLHGVFTRTFSMTRYIEGNWFTPQESVSNIIEYMTFKADADAIPFDTHAFTTFSPTFFYAGIIATVIVAGLFFIRKRRYDLLAILAITHLAYIMIQLTPIKDMIPYYYSTYGQIYVYYPLVAFFAITIALLIEHILELTNKKATYGLVLAVLIIIAMSPVFTYSHNMGAYLREGSVTSADNIAWLYNPMEQIGSGGAFAVFGLYGPGYIPAISKYTDLEAFAGYGIESHCTLQSYEKRIVPLQEASMDNLLTDNAAYAYNIFKQSNVRVLAFQRCSYAGTVDPTSGGGRAFAVLSNDTRFKAITDVGCIGLLSIPQAQKVEKVLLTEVLVENPDESRITKLNRGGGHGDLDDFLTNREKAINAMISVPAGEHLHFTADEFAFGEDKYANVIINRSASRDEIQRYLDNNSTVIYFGKHVDLDDSRLHQYESYPESSDKLDEILKNARYTDVPVNFKKDGNEYSFSQQGMVLVKETYFRKRHSDADLKESYLGFMLLDSSGETRLWYAPTWVDYLGALLTVLGLYALYMLLSDKRITARAKEKKAEDEEPERKGKGKGKRKKKKDE